MVRSIAGGLNAYVAQREGTASDASDNVLV